MENDAHRPLPADVRQSEEMANLTAQQRRLLEQEAEQRRIDIENADRANREYEQRRHTESEGEFRVGDCRRRGATTGNEARLGVDASLSYSPSQGNVFSQPARAEEFDRLDGGFQLAPLCMTRRHAGGPAGSASPVVSPGNHDGGGGV